MTMRWVVGFIGASGIALAVAGCPLPNPCPLGMTRRGNRCVAAPHAGTGNDSGVTDELPSTRAEDASPEANDQPDADGEAQDAGMDATSEVEDADVHAGADPGEGEPDSGSDGGDDRAACDDAPLAQWRNFQLSGRTVLALNDCRALRPPCAGPSCDLDACMRETVGVSGCEACIANEVSCLAGRCAPACALPDAFDSCRKCACDNGCMGAAMGCGLRELDVCFDCTSGTCQDISTDPSIAMQVFNFGTLIVPPIP